MLDWRDELRATQTETNILQCLAADRYRKEREAQDVAIGLASLDPAVMNQRQRQMVLAACDEYRRGAMRAVGA